MNTNVSKELVKELKVSTYTLYKIFVDFFVYRFHYLGTCKISFLHTEVQSQIMNFLVKRKHKPP